MPTGQAFEGSPDPVVVLGLDGGLAAANAAWRALGGAAGFLDAIHPDDLPAIRGGIAGASGEPAPVVARVRMMPGGAWCIIDWRFRLIEGRVHGFGRDFTDGSRRRALTERQEQILLSIAAERPIAETLEMVCLAVEALIEGAIGSVLILSRDGTKLLHGAAPHLPEAYSAMIDGLAIGPGVGNCGTAAYRGETVIIEDTLKDPLWEPYRDLARRFGLRSAWSTPIILPNQGVVGTFAVYRHVPYLPNDWDHEVTRRLTGATAIALSQARIRDGLRDSLAELVQREKLASLGQLVVGIAHEANTPIGVALTAVTSLKAATDRLADRVAKGELKKSELARFAGEAEKAATLTEQNLKRAADLVRTFRQAAEDRTTGSSRVVDVPAYLRMVVEELEAGLQPQGIAMRVEAPKLPKFLIAPGLLAQVCASLIENAVAHAFDGVANPMVTLSISVPKPDRLMVTVSDNGIGMSPETRAKSLDPFFTTRRDSGRMGLGLYVVHNLVTGPLRGGLEVASEPGKGSRFSVTIPVQEVSRH